MRYQVNNVDINMNEYTDKAFGSFVRKRHEELKISVREIVGKIGISAICLSDIERGNRNASVGTSSKKD